MSTRQSILAELSADDTGMAARFDTYIHEVTKGLEIPGVIEELILSDLGAERTEEDMVRCWEGFKVRSAERALAVQQSLEAKKAFTQHGSHVKRLFPSGRTEYGLLMPEIEALSPFDGHKAWYDCVRMSGVTPDATPVWDGESLFAFKTCLYSELELV